MNKTTSKTTTKLTTKKIITTSNTTIKITLTRTRTKKKFFFVIRTNICTLQEAYHMWDLMQLVLKLYMGQNTASDVWVVVIGVV